MSKTQHDTTITFKSEIVKHHVFSPCFLDGQQIWEMEATVDKDKSQPVCIPPVQHTRRVVMRPFGSIRRIQVRDITDPCVAEHAVCGGAALQRHVSLPLRQSQLLRHQWQEEAQPAAALHLHSPGRYGCGTLWYTTKNNHGS